MSKPAAKAGQVWRMPDGKEAKVLGVSGRGGSRSVYVLHNGYRRWVPVAWLKRGELVDAAG